MANQACTRTTLLYGPTRREVTLDEVERVGISGRDFVDGRPREHTLRFQRMHSRLTLRIGPSDVSAAAEAQPNALVFKAPEPVSLAAAVAKLMANPELYRSLSNAAGKVAENYLCPLKWHDLIDTWLRGGAERDAYPSLFSLAHRISN